MKLPCRLAVLSILIFLNVLTTLPPARAQQPDGAAGRSGQSQASLVGGTPILAELNASIDSKKAKAGDTVAAHTYEAVKSADGRIILPKGTKLTGRLAQSMARSKGDGESALGFVFEKATLKDGSDVPLLVRVQAIAEPVTFPAMSTPGADTSSLGTTQTSPMGGNSRMGPPGSQAPRSGVNGDDNGETGMSSADLNPQSRGVLGIRGLKLAANVAEGKIVSTVSSDGKNVRLDSGTRFLLVTAAIAPDESTDQRR